MTKQIQSIFDKEKLNCAAGVVYKSFVLKRKIIFEIAQAGELTVNDLAKILKVSNPTISKLLTELLKEGYVKDMGKIETAGGRRPISYGLIPSAGYFLGVDMADDHINFELIDLCKKQVQLEMARPFIVKNDYTTLDKLANEIENFIEQNNFSKKQILGLGLIIKGRVDSSSGHSYNIFNFDPRPVSELLTKRCGIQTIVENDTRAMAYAEWTQNSANIPANALFVNVGKGVGVGIIIEGKLYYGKSGFSGEFGHIPFFDNQTICHCGKKGCLETEASGAALIRNFESALLKGASSILSDKFQKNGHVALNDILDSVTKDDVLSIELITTIGEKLGRGIGVLLNIFNPELVVVGGVISSVGDYIMLPIRTALNKYSLSLVNRDSMIKLSELGESAGVKGAALLARNRILEVD